MDILCSASSFAIDAASRASSATTATRGLTALYLVSARYRCRFFWKRGSACGCYLPYKDDRVSDVVSRTLSVDRTLAGFLDKRRDERAYWDSDSRV